MREGRSSSTSSWTSTVKRLDIGIDSSNSRQNPSMSARTRDEINRMSPSRQTSISACKVATVLLSNPTRNHLHRPCPTSANSSISAQDGATEPARFHLANASLDHTRRTDIGGSLPHEIWVFYPRFARLTNRLGPYFPGPVGSVAASAFPASWILAVWVMLFHHFIPHVSLGRECAGNPPSPTILSRHGATGLSIRLDSGFAYM